MLLTWEVVEVPVGWGSVAAGWEKEAEEETATGSAETAASGHARGPPPSLAWGQTKASLQRTHAVCWSN